MSGNEQITDLNNLSDEDFMKLSPEAIQAEMDKKPVDVKTEDTITEVIEEIKEEDTSNKEENEDENKDKEEQENKDKIEKDNEEDNKLTDDELKNKSVEDNKKDSENDNKEEVKTDTESNKEEETKTPEKNDKSEVNTEIEDFYKRLTAPFKADGKEVTIRSADDAIRLMQKGINYSRRMEEIKPLRAQDSMLKAHGITTPEQLSYLIDLHNGKPDAIQKLLKDKKIDPLNINTEEESTYKTVNYSPDPKDITFKEAIETTLAHPKGSDLLKDINKTWDDESKEALRDQPTIFENLLAQTETGVYKQIIEELDYQRTMGHLTQVPFLQAYHMVGDAMQKAGVFSKPKTHSDGLAPLKSKPAPIDTGIRKVTKEIKSPAPVIQPIKVKSSNGGDKEEIDYSTMSDKDFLKLSAPN